jgi:predicted  nucleic acid-binding Zn-ribbon protein
MNEVYEKLRQLQEILSEKFKIEQEIVEIPKVLSTKTELLNRLKKQYIEKNSVRERTKEKITALRTQLAETEQLREGYEKQMDIIQTQREYEVLDKEIKDATEREQTLRKDILREERELEELQASLEREESMIETQESDLENEKKKIESESQTKRNNLDDLTSKEKDLIPGLDEDILFKFERIIRSKSGLGIVPVKGAVCTGCHMQLPVHFVNEVRGGENIRFCPYCSRILYYQDEVVEDQAGSANFLSEEDEGGLAGLVGDIEL